MSGYDLGFVIVYVSWFTTAAVLALIVRFAASAPYRDRARPPTAPIALVTFAGLTCLALFLPWIDRTTENGVARGENGWQSLDPLTLMALVGAVAVSAWLVFAQPSPAARSRRWLVWLFAPWTGLVAGNVLIKATTPFGDVLPGAFVTLALAVTTLVAVLVAASANGGP